MCERLSWPIICKRCLEQLSNIHSQRNLNGLKVFSTFAFSELKNLITSKNNIIGSRILKRIGQYGVQKFFEKYPELLQIQKENIAVICVRNRTVGLYSHSAILAHCFTKYNFKVFYNMLVIGNNNRFSLLSRQQRQEIGRKFSFHLKHEFDGYIIVDDVITTGQTLIEAFNIIKNHNCVPLYAWTLCDSRY